MIQILATFWLIMASFDLVGLDQDYSFHPTQTWISPIGRMNASKLTKNYPKNNLITSRFINYYHVLPQVRPRFSASRSVAMDSRIAKFVQE